MNTDEMNREIQMAVENKESHRLLVIILLFGLMDEDTNFSKACEKIELLIWKFGAMLETEPPASDSEYKILVDYVNNFMAENKAQILEHIGFEEENLSLYWTSKMLRIRAKLNFLNSTSPHKIDYMWFFPEVVIEDADAVLSVIPKVFECLEDIGDSKEWMNHDEDLDVFDFIEFSPYELYNSLTGCLSKEEANFVTFENKMGYFDTTGLIGAKTFYELWRGFDFSNFLNLLTWGADKIKLSRVPIPDVEPLVEISKVSIYDRELIKLKKQYETLREIRVKLIKHETGDENDEHNDNIDKVLKRVSVLEEIIAYLIGKMTKEKQNTEDDIKLKERNRILSNLSHSIKNMLRSVIDPLLNLKEEFPERSKTIDNALKGANLIREIVNSINLSFKTSIDDLIWDIQHPGTESVSLQDMIINSLQYSIGNMFDFRYFPAYAENYYPHSLKKDDYEAVKTKWNAIASTSELSDLQAFTESYMFNLSVMLSDSAQYHIGNEKSSAIKLLILFQEIIFNAVKYASYVPRAERFIEIELSEHDDKMKLQIRNSFRPEVQAKTTGVGKLVIENFAKVLDCIPVISTDNNVYSISMEFNNIWRNHA